MTRTVSLAYFPDFNDPTVLFWGEADGLSRLAQFLADEVTEQPVRLHDKPWIAPRGEIRLIFELGADDVGIRKREGGDADFKWRVTSALAQQFSAMIASLAESEGAGHQYLDSDRGDATVMVSMGEYPMDMTP